MRATTWKVKRLSLQRCALRKFHVTDGQNTRGQSTRGMSNVETRVIKLRFVYSIHS